MIDPVTSGAASVKTAGQAGVPLVRSIAGPATPAASNENRASNVPLPRLLDLVAELTRRGPPVDDARIAQLRRAIADRSYKIDADLLAKSIIGFVGKD